MTLVNFASNLRDAQPPVAGRVMALHLSGHIPYLPMWECQRSLAATRERGEVGDLLLLLEHEHVYTNGRRGDRSHLLANDATLARLGAAYHSIDRGGDITYHGPGQVVGYPIVHLGHASLSIRSYVRGLEEALIRTVAYFGLKATSIPGYTGVWVGDDKLAAIGVKVSYGVAYHGFALNVSTDLSYFDHIVACGIPDRGVTSLERLLGRVVAIEEVAYLCARSFAETFDLDLHWMQSSDAAWKRPDQDVAAQPSLVMLRGLAEYVNLSAT